MLIRHRDPEQLRRLDSDENESLPNSRNNFHCQIYNMRYIIINLMLIHVSSVVLTPSSYIPSTHFWLFECLTTFNMMRDIFHNYLMFMLL